MTDRLPLYCFPAVDRDKICGVKTVTHFTNDLQMVKGLIAGLEYPKGSTLTSLALMAAKAEVSLGRATTKANVVVFTDGRPLSYRNTGIAAEQVRKVARLLWVPVTQYAPLAEIKLWATRRWQENVVHVSSFDELEKPDVITHIIADLCPETDPHVRFSRVALE